MPAGVVRGCGRQTMAVGLNLLTFWGVGLPLCAFLGFQAGDGGEGAVDWYGYGMPFHLCMPVESHSSM